MKEIEKKTKRKEAEEKEEKMLLYKNHSSNIINQPEILYYTVCIKIVMHLYFRQLQNSVYVCDKNCANLLRINYFIMRKCRSK